MRAWLQQQIAEKKQDEMEKEKAEQMYMAAMVARDRRAVELAKLEEECTRKLIQSNAEFNRLLVAIELSLISYLYLLPRAFIVKSCIIYVEVSSMT